VSLIPHALILFTGAPAHATSVGLDRDGPEACNNSISLPDDAIGGVQGAGAASVPAGGGAEARVDGRNARKTTCDVCCGGRARHGVSAAVIHIKDCNKLFPVRPQKIQAQKKSLNDGMPMANPWPTLRESEGRRSLIELPGCMLVGSA
jgi:hypothetical protein